MGGGNGAIGIAHLCAMPGPFDLVDRGGEWVQLVALDRCHHCGVLWLWLLVGCCLVTPQGQHHTLLCNMGSSLVVGSQPGGGTCPLDVVGGSIPLCHCISFGWYGGDRVKM